MQETKKPVGPAFDPNKPFGIVHGVPGVGFVQGKHYYDKWDKILIGPAPPEAHLQAPTPEVVLAKKREALLEAAKVTIGRVPAVPDRIARAAKEDAMAKRAEEEFGGH